MLRSFHLCRNALPLSSTTRSSYVFCSAYRTVRFVQLICAGYFFQSNAIAASTHDRCQEQAQPGESAFFYFTPGLKRVNLIRKFLGSVFLEQIQSADIDSHLKIGRHAFGAQEISDQFSSFFSSQIFYDQVKAEFVSQTLDYAGCGSEYTNIV